MKSSLSIQEKLKELRVERGLTPDEFADQTDLPKSALSSYETNDFKDIIHASIVTLAKFYGVSAGADRKQKPPKHRPCGTAFG